MKVVIGAFLLLAFGAIGAMGVEDDIKQQARYCQMVEEGLWGNYKPEVNCEESHEAL